MPAKQKRYEDDLVRLFVSAYENFAWAGSEIEYPDKKIARGVDGLVTRADGQKMAIEHTLIEPFVGDKDDFAAFGQAFLRIEDDESLAVPNTEITVNIPVGILDGQKPAKREAIVVAIHSWIAKKRLNLRDGKHGYQCDIPGMPPVTLTVERNMFGPPQGIVWVRRQQVTNDLDKVIEKALRRKLPKLVKTKADRHVLFLERDQFTFHPDLIFAEIERQRPNFGLLESVDEIWHVETIFYKRFGTVRFELPKGGRVLATIAFKKDELLLHYKDGMPYPM